MGTLAAVCASASALLLAPAASARPATTFVSKLYAYSILLPGARGRWSARFAIVRWTTDSLPGINETADDTYADRSTGRVVLIAARRTRSTLGAWTAFVVGARPSVCGAPRSRAGSTLGGAPARVVTWSCSDGYWVVVISAVHAGRGYFILVASPSRLSHAADMQAYAAARRGFRFRR